ncbi:MAG: type II toxin-antitoxin system death-on-curing family toxin [Nitratireductor sp.]
MTQHTYLDMEDILEIHAAQIKRFGGAGGIRDAGMIEAALQRPMSGYYRDLIEEAAALWESLTMNHGFIDGNKRVGFAATYVFLRMNGLKISATPSNATRFVLERLQSGMFTKDNLDAWLRANTKPA